MIEGNGLIGKEFKKNYIDDNSVVIYAAGVSNSKCQDLSEFKRDIGRLKNSIDKSHNYNLFLYFSTISIFDENLARHSEYIQHKIKCEEMVKQHNNYLIIRLGQVAGFSKNPNTLLNYIDNCIKNNIIMKLQKNAYRNIIDVKDIVLIVTDLIKLNLKNQTINLVTSNDYNIKEIVGCMEKALNKIANYEIVDGESRVIIDRTILEQYVDMSRLNNNSYMQDTINKYYKAVENQYD